MCAVFIAGAFEAYPFSSTVSRVNAAYHCSEQQNIRHRYTIMEALMSLVKRWFTGTSDEYSPVSGSVMKCKMGREAPTSGANPEDKTFLPLVKLRFGCLRIEKFLPGVPLHFRQLPMSTTQRSR